MKANELRDLEPYELDDKLRDLEEELFNLNFRRAIDDLDNPLKIRQIRRDIARVKTVLRERELGVEIKPRKVELSS